MKKLIIAFTLVFMITVKPQTTYEVTPGTKGNRVILSLSNISELINAENVQVKSLINHGNIIFSKESQKIEKINPKEEKEVIFEFDVRREVPVNKKKHPGVPYYRQQGYLHHKTICIKLYSAQRL
jgi:hypothetical protein